MSHACHHFWNCDKTLRCRNPCACQTKWRLTESGVRACSVFTILTSMCASRHTSVHFSTFQLPKVVRDRGVLTILASKSASRHSGVQFLISHLTRWLRTHHFSEPTFQPPGAPKHWKNAVFRDFPTFSHTWVLFLLTLSLLWSSLFGPLFLTLPTSAFPSVHIVESLTSKLSPDSPTLSG